ncbi:MAG: fasciclin domain-containing protein [Saprospiraceae bacterium]|nr:fasciclin domain-containing protein [Saprospiraceae bacterium]
MKSLIYFFSCLLVAGMPACTAPVDNGGDAAAEGSARIMGQSAVSDATSDANILQVAIGSEDHSTLVAGVQAAELEDVLVNAGPLTVFAPNNAAFDALPEGTLDELLKPENKDKLARIIKYHASPGKYMGDMLKNGMRLFQATGHYITVERDGNEVRVGGARILGTVEASNGVVHVIDKVLLPPD